MFDIGFAELLVCLIVALVVIGPEQLPGTVRTVGLWIGRLKRSLRETRTEIERQIGADDIRRQLHNEEILKNIEDTRRQFQQSMAEAENAVSVEAAEVTARLALTAQHYGPPEELPNHAHSEGPPSAIASNLTPEHAFNATKAPASPTETDPKSV